MALISKYNHLLYVTIHVYHRGHADKLSGDIPDVQIIGGNVQAALWIVCHGMFPKDESI